ncbi:hypothetical protein RCL1_001830 [Eukaryota sp. TZLM3-RCL]
MSLFEISFTQLFDKSAANPFSRLDINQFVSASVQFPDSSSKRPFLPFASRDIPPGTLLVVEHAFTIIWPVQKFSETSCCSLCSLRNSFDKEFARLSSIHKKALISRLSTHSLPPSPSSEDLHQFVIEQCFPLSHAQYWTRSKPPDLFPSYANADEGRGMFILSCNIPVACVPNCICFTVSDCLFIFSSRSIPVGHPLLLPLESRPGLDCFASNPNSILKNSKLDADYKDYLENLCEKCSYEGGLPSKTFFTVCSHRSALADCLLSGGENFDENFDFHFNSFHSIAATFPKGLPHLQIDVALCYTLKYLTSNFKKAVNSLKFAYKLTRKCSLGHCRRLNSFLKLIRLVALHYENNLKNSKMSIKWMIRLKKLTYFPFNSALLFPLFVRFFVDSLETPSILSLLEDDLEERDHGESEEETDEDSGASQEEEEFEIDLVQSSKLSTVIQSTIESSLTDMGDVALSNQSFHHLHRVLSISPQELSDTMMHLLKLAKESYHDKTIEIESIEVEKSENFNENFNENITANPEDFTKLIDLASRLRSLLLQRKLSSLLRLLYKASLQHVDPTIGFFAGLCFQAVGDFPASLAIFEKLRVAALDKLPTTVSCVISEAFTGEYNLDSIFSQYADHPYSCVMHSEYHNISITFKPSPPYGLGVYATQRVEPGGLLLVERALVMQYPVVGEETGYCDPLVELTQKLMSLVDEIPEKIKKMLLTLPRRSGWTTMVKKLKKDQEMTSSLVRKSIEANLFPLSHRQFCFHPVPKPLLLGGYGIFLKASRFSHSCCPNAIYFTVGDLIFIKAIRAISAGEEITLQRVVPNSTGQLFSCFCSCCTQQLQNGVTQYEQLKKLTNMLFSTNNWTEFQPLFNTFMELLSSLPRKYPQLTAEVHSKAALHLLNINNYQEASKFAAIAFNDLLSPESSGMDVIPFIEVLVSIRDYFIKQHDMNEAKIWDERAKSLLVFLGVDPSKPVFFTLLVKQLRLKKRIIGWVDNSSKEIVEKN